MRLSRRMICWMPTMAVIAVVTMLPSRVMGQESSGSGQAAPAVSGTGNAGKIAVWKNSTTLGNSVLSQSGGNVGIGTTTPAAKLEVNGNAQVDGNFSLSGSILLNGAGQLIWAPNDGSQNFSAGLDALPPTTTGTQNTALGNGALQNNTAGYSNTAVGAGALAATGIEGPFGSNTAVGAGALQNNTVGSANTAIGVNAMIGNSGGGANVAVGAYTLHSTGLGAIPPSVMVP